MENKINTLHIDEKFDPKPKVLRDDYGRKPKNAKQWERWTHLDEDLEIDDDDYLDHFIDEGDIFYP